MLRLFFRRLMKKFVFFSVIFLAILAVYVFVSWQNKDDDIEIDVTDTGFEYDVAACDKYFELVDCIIDNDQNQNRNQQMRQDLKIQIKAKQEEWKQFNEKELIKNCEDELKNLENQLEERKLDSFGCYSKVNY